MTAQILKIDVSNIHAPLRDPRKVTHPCFRPDLEIWHHKRESYTPVTIPLAEVTTDLVVHLRHDDSLFGNKGILIGSAEGVRFSSEEFTFPDSSNLVIVTVTIDGWSSKVPWGIAEDVEWKLELKSSGESVSLAKTYLQIFAVSDDLPDFFAKQGIPLQLLELMVLPTINKGLKTRNAWIGFAVRRCFASKLDPYLEATKPELYKEAIHSYRYNSFNGGQPNYWHFSGVYDLNKWLENFNPPGPNQWYAVNCYDMSATVQTVLALGIPFQYTDSKGDTFAGADPHVEDYNRSVQAVGKVFKEKFGYIKKADLIGWGESDSPFFDDKKDMLLNRAEGHDDDEPTRQSFGTHAWVFIRDADDIDKLWAVDACAGPVADPILMTDYIEGVIDHVSTDKHNKFKGNRDAKLELLRGVENIIPDQPLWPGEQYAWSGSSRLKLMYGTSSLGFYNARPNDTLKEVQELGKYVQPIPVPMDGFFRAAFKTLAESTNSSPPTANDDIHVCDSATFAFGKFTVQTTDPQVTEAGSILRFDIWTEDSGAPFLSVTVSVLTNFSQAMEWLVGHLNAMSHSVDASWPVYEDALKSGRVRVDPKDDPLVAIGAFICSNVLVTMEGTADNATMKAVLATMNNFIFACQDQDLRKVDPSNAQLTTSEPLVVGKPFKLNIEAPDTVDLSVASTTKAIYIEQDPSKHSKDSNSWVVDCVVVDCKDKFKPKEKVVVSFAAKDTYYTTTRTWELDVSK
ncbi:Fc.00g026930.m01.CDS01 [Cosmosporella sp. VM-42]